MIKNCIPYLLTLLSACVPAGQTGQPERRVIARAGEAELDQDDYLEAFMGNVLGRDSLSNARRSIELWATEELLYQEALGELTVDERNVDRQVEEYRKALINHIYESKIIEVNLDTTITDEEIEDYYNSHRDNFILKENILKVNYLKIAQRSPVLPKVKKILFAPASKEREQLNALLVQNAENFFMDDSTWLFLDDIKKEIPQMVDQPDYQFSAGRVLEFDDEMYYYYLKVKDVKVKNGLSPLNFERQNIRKFILNKRKAQLISQYKQEMLEKAKAQKSFTVY